MNTKLIIAKSETIVDDPPILGFLTQNISMTWIWTSARLILGLGFLQLAASHDQVARHVDLTDFLRISARTTSLGPSFSHKSIHYEWFQNVIQGLPEVMSHYSLTNLIALGEVAIGLCLIFGVFYGMISLFGIFFNWKLMTVAVVSANAYLFVASLLLILVWKFAVYFLPQLASYRSAMEKRKRLPRLTVG